VRVDGEDPSPASHHQLHAPGISAGGDRFEVVLVLHFSIPQPCHLASAATTGVNAPTGTTTHRPRASVVQLKCWLRFECVYPARAIVVGVARLMPAFDADDPGEGSDTSVPVPGDPGGPSEGLKPPPPVTSPGPTLLAASGA
jgi:hypothetical protein